MNKKNFAIYICIIIVFAALFFKPQQAKGAECVSTMGKVYDALVEAAKSLRKPGEAASFLNLMREIILGENMTLCDEDGNVVVNPTGPTPTYDPNFPTPPPSDGSWPFFCQTDPKLQNAALSPPLSGYGCGQTSLAMAACKLNGFDNSSKTSCPFQPATVAFKGMSTGSYKYPAGTYFGAGYQSEMDYFGLEWNLIPVNLNIWKEYFDRGWVVITHAHQMRCGIGCSNPNHIIGHVFTVDQADPATNAIRLRDPINCTYAEGYQEHVVSGKWWRLTDFISGPKMVYAVRKKI